MILHEDHDLGEILRKKNIRNDEFISALNSVLAEEKKKIESEMLWNSENLKLTNPIGRSFYKTP